MCACDTPVLLSGAEYSEDESSRSSGIRRPGGTSVRNRLYASLLLFFEDTQYTMTSPDADLWRIKQKISFHSKQSLLLHF